MIFIKCPYCERDMDILFSDRIDDLLKHNKMTINCTNCQKLFTVFIGKTKIESKVLDEDNIGGNNAKY